MQRERYTVRGEKRERYAVRGKRVRDMHGVREREREREKE